MGDNALDSARQMYFFSGSPEQNLYANFGLFAFHSDTGKRIGGPFSELTDATGLSAVIAMTVIPKCECCKVQGSRRRESWEQLSFLFLT